MIEKEMKRKPKQVPVTVIWATEESSLIEFTYGGLLQRVIIPSQDVIDEKVSDDILPFGIPYGVAWEDVPLKASSIMLANQLRANGIWTYDDARTKPMQIVACLQAVYGVDLAALFEYARENK
jgi:hypothetical protein